MTDANDARVIRANVSKNFTDELVTFLTQRDSDIQDTDGISWGCPSLNYICTGNPFVGLAFGRVYELFGEESSGKTTLALHAVAAAQQKGWPVAYIDAEQALDVGYAQAIGVNTDMLIFSQPDYGEQALDVALALVDAGTRLIVVDSVAALTPLDELEATMEKDAIGLQARMMSKFLRKSSSRIRKSQSAVLFINQTRLKIGVMFGNPETTPAGKALRFYSSVRLRCHLSTAADKAIKGVAVGTLMSAEENARLGSVLKVTIPKNKLAPPFQSCEIPLYYGRGLDIVGDWYAFAAKLGLIEKARGAYVVKKKRIPLSGLSAQVETVMNLVQQHFAAQLKK